MTVSGTGTVVAGRYELLEVIGRGGSSTVHRARDLRHDRLVAIKVMPTGDSPDECRRLRREVAVLSALRHPALVPVLDQHVDASAVHIVMELLTEGSLRGALRRGPIDPPTVATIGADVAAALAHIHARGIVHRDVKPANVLLHDGGTRAKLTDFGIARHLDAETTTTASIVGTALYVSPEQARGHRVGPPSDVYSLGLTLLEALTGGPAFPGTLAESLAARLLRDPSLPAGFSPGWRSLISAMTTRNPAARPDAAEVARRLDVVCDISVEADTVELPVLPSRRSPHPAPGTTRPLPTRPRTARRRVRSAAVVAALALVVSGSVILDASAPATAPVDAAGTAGVAVPHAVASTSPRASTPAQRSGTASSRTTASATVQLAAATVTATKGAAASSRSAAAGPAAGPAAPRSAGPAKAAAPKPPKEPEKVEAPKKPKAPKKAKAPEAGKPATPAPAPARSDPGGPKRP